MVNTAKKPLTDEQEARKRELLDDACHCTGRIEAARKLLTMLAAQRRASVQELQDLGVSRQEIGEKMGISKSGVQQILKA